MRKSFKQLSTASLGAFSITVLAGSSALACGMGSNYQNNQTSSYAGKDYSYSSRADMGQSAYYADGSTDSHTSGYNSGDGHDYTDTNTKTTDLEYRLGMQLSRHAMLTEQWLRLQNQQADLRSEMEDNNQAIADTINQLYPGTRSQFLQLWRDHITYYQQYLTATEQNDSEGRQQAVQDLASFESDMADLFENANSQYDSAGLEQWLAMHVNHTISYIDNLVADDQSGQDDTNDTTDMPDMMEDGYAYAQ